MVVAISHGSAARPNASSEDSLSSSAASADFSRNLCRAMLGESVLIDIRYKLAWYLMAEGRYQEAAEHLRKTLAMKLNPESSPIS